MGTLIVIGLIGWVIYLAVCDMWSIPGRMVSGVKDRIDEIAEEAQRSEDEQQRQYEEEVVETDGREFGAGLLDNQAVLDMAEAFSQMIHDYLMRQADSATENRCGGTLVWEIFDIYMPCYIPLYQWKWIPVEELELRFSEFGLQITQGLYKLYGFGWALRELTEAKLQEKLASSVCRAALDLSFNYLGDDKGVIYLTLAWAIEQNKFIEL